MEPAATIFLRGNLRHLLKSLKHFLNTSDLTSMNFFLFMPPVDYGAYFPLINSIYLPFTGPSPSGWITELLDFYIWEAPSYTTLSSAS